MRYSQEESYSTTPARLLHENPISICSHKIFFFFGFCMGYMADDELRSVCLLLLMKKKSHRYIYLIRIQK